MSIMNNFPAGGGSAGEFKELSLSDFYSAVGNGESGMVLIENENLSGGSFVLPYSYSIEMVDQSGYTEIIFSSHSFVVVIDASAIRGLIRISDMAGEEIFVEIYPGENMENFASGWSARYFTIN